MRIMDSVLMELSQEARTTKNFLERVPTDKLTWKPHEKSLTLGQLAMHIAGIPGQVAKMISTDRMEMPDSFNFLQAANKDEIISAFENGLKKAEEFLSGMEDREAMVPWKLVKGGKVIWEAPRVGVIRSLMLNHWYQHRGQLGVYLRLLGCSVPSSYGPSGDENPFT